MASNTFTRHTITGDTQHTRKGTQGRKPVANRLGKPLGWAQGFLKEDDGVFSPNRASFGHPGMGGALGWCDPSTQLAFAYTMNRCDWHIRSPRTMALCEALYRCDVNP